jgi:quinol monooxygenase YgiN
MHISPKSTLITLINVFETKPEQQQALLEELSHFASSIVKEEPACLGVALHRSIDGTRVTNYAQWRSQEDLDRFVKKYREQMETLLRLAERADAHVYEMASLHEEAGKEA